MCHRVSVCVFLAHAYLSTYRCVDVLLMEVVIHCVRQASARAHADAHTHTMVSTNSVRRQRGLIFQPSGLQIQTTFHAGWCTMHLGWAFTSSPWELTASAALRTHYIKMTISKTSMAMPLFVNEILNIKSYSTSNY